MAVETQQSREFRSGLGERWAKGKYKGSVLWAPTSIRRIYAYDPLACSPRSFGKGGCRVERVFLYPFDDHFVPAFGALGRLACRRFGGGISRKESKACAFNVHTLEWGDVLWKVLSFWLSDLIGVSPTGWLVSPTAFERGIGLYQCKGLVSYVHYSESFDRILIRLEWVRK
jgi:hypothetical protein